MKKITILFSLLVASTLLISGCTQKPNSSDINQPAQNQPQENQLEQLPPAQPPQAQLPSTNENQTSNITIKSFTFNPATLTIKAGTTVTWKNLDSAPHKINSNPHPIHTSLPELSSPTLAQGESYSFTFSQKGSFGYHCHLHPSMTGTIIVE